MGSSQQDSTLGIKKESTYGTAVTVDRFYETIAPDTFEAKPEFRTSGGMRAGARAPRASASTLVKKSAEGGFEIEAAASQLGLLLEAALGIKTVTSIPSAPAVFQQVHTPTDTDYVPSYTIQTGRPLLGGGAVQAATYKGAQCESIKFASKAGEMLNVSTEWMAKDYDTAIAYQAPSYPATLLPFAFVHSAIIAAGTLTKPTTTALASMTGTALANVEDFEFTWANGLDQAGFNMGGAGARTRPSVVTKGELTGSLTVEYTDNAFRDAWLNNTSMALLLTFTRPEVLAAGVFPTLQIVVPLVKLRGEMPKDSRGEAAKQKFTIENLDAEDGTSKLVYVVYRSLDTAV